MSSLDLKIEGLTETSSAETKTSSPIISSLKSKFKLGGKTAASKTETAESEKPGTRRFDIEKIFIILRDFLQPNTTLSLESVAQDILEFLPDNAAYDKEVYTFGEVIFEIAEQIPYHHPSQLKLARLMERIGQSMKITSIHTSKEGKTTISRFQYLSESQRDARNGPDDEDPGAWVNYNAFVANLYELHIWRTHPTYAIWAMREALEEPNDEKGPIRDSNILAAAQWILWNGQSLFKQILFLGDVSADDKLAWKPGKLYDGEQLLTLYRWHFWRDGFRAVAGEDDVSDECENVARKVADLMDSIEKGLTF